MSAYSRHPIIGRTTITRDCPHCEGSGEVTVNDTNPHGYGPDPQCDEAVTCSQCIDGLQTIWTDPLLTMAKNRKGYRRAFYPRDKARAMRPVLGQLRMIESAIRCDLACRDAVAAWRVAA